MTLPLLITLIFIALAMEGFFSGSEMALISADRLALHKLARAGNKGARLAIKLISRPERILATTLVGTQLCVAFEAIAATLYIYQQWGHQYDWYSVLVLSPVVLIFGEILPKTIFQRYAERFAPKVARSIVIADWAFAPITWILGRYTDWLSKKIRPIEEAITGRPNPTHREELRYLLTYGQKELGLKSSERRMIRRILDFSRAEAKNVLIPLVNVDMIEDTLTVGDALQAFTSYGHSRLPVYHERVDNVVGVLHVFDLFSELDMSKPVTKIMQPACYAPETQQLETLLFTLQKRGIQMTIVVDEYGGAIGVLTLEDILEEIVGDIKDEYDHDSSLYRQIQDKEYLIQSQMEISAFNEIFKATIPRADYETLSGFLLQQFNRIPEEGDELYYGDLKFVIRKASSRRILLVELTLLQ